MVRLHRDLISLRLNRAGHTAGLTGQHIQILHVDYAEKIIAYHRWKEGGSADSVVVVLNLRDKRHEQYHIPFPSVGQWTVRFNGDWEGYDQEFTNHEVDSVVVDGYENGFGDKVANVSLPPYGIVILSQD